MSGFSADWLALREPADTAARSATIVKAVPRGPERLEVVDLGAGTGANLRYLAPRLGGDQRWRLVDDDDAVLAEAARLLRAWAAADGLGGTESNGRIAIRGSTWSCEIELMHADLAADLDRVLPTAGGLVTASALLDLVSAEWLATLAGRCAEAGSAVLFALTFDGRMHCAPEEPADRLVRALVNRHQCSDKGFGPALGPRAATRAAAAFAGRGYALRMESSDWRLDARQAALQTALLDGWLTAATEMAPDQRASLEGWHRRRVEHVERGDSVFVVGHYDLAGSCA